MKTWQNLTINSKIGLAYEDRGMAVKPGENKNLLFADGNCFIIWFPQKGLWEPDKIKLLCARKKARHSYQNWQMHKIIYAYKSFATSSSPNS